MSVQIYSRDYLQSIPEERKQKKIDTMVSGFIQNLKETAAVGVTSYRWDLLVDEKGCERNLFKPQQNRIIVLTIEDIISGFQERFPGCKVFYEEAWVDSGRDTKTLKKWIVIDWS